MAAVAAAGSDYFVGPDVDRDRVFARLVNRYCLCFPFITIRLLDKSKIKARIGYNVASSPLAIHTRLSPEHTTVRVNTRSSTGNSGR